MSTKFICKEGRERDRIRHKVAHKTINRSIISMQCFAIMDNPETANEVIVDVAKRKDRNYRHVHKWITRSINDEYDFAHSSYIESIHYYLFIQIFIILWRIFRANKLPPKNADFDIHEVWPNFWELFLAESQQ